MKTQRGFPGPPKLMPKSWTSKNMGDMGLRQKLVAYGFEYIGIYWNICGIYVEYMWNILEYIRIYVEYMWNICGIYWNMWNICGIYVEYIGIYWNI